MSSCDCDWEADGTWEEISRSWQKSRKPRRCDECGAAIAKGERYHREVGKWEGNLVTNDYCALCMRVSEVHWVALRALTRQRPYDYSCSSYVLGELRCAIRCMTTEEPVYREAFRKAWREQKVAA